MGDVVQKLNPIVLVCAILTIAMVLVQAFGFFKQAGDFNKKHKVLTEDEKKMVIKSGIISSIGPAISVLVVAISFLSLFGEGTTLIRLGVIGSAPYELMLANVAADTVGLDLNTQALTENAFTLMLFAMAFGSAPYFINCFFTLKPLERTLLKNKENKASFASIVGGIATIALITYFTVDNVKKGGISIAVFIASALSTAILTKIAKSTGKRWISEWNMGISLVVGIIVATIMISKGIGA